LNNRESSSLTAAEQSNHSVPTEDTPYA
jgi:hypothetical protein